VSVSQAALTVAVETTFFSTLDQAAPVFQALGISGVQGWIGPTSHPLLNMVGMAKLNEATADAVIGEVINQYAADGKAFGWLIGPNTTPLDLAARLEAAGMQMFVAVAGMALTDLSQLIPANPNVHVEEATFDELRNEADLIAAAFGHATTREDANALVDIWEASKDRYHSRGYLVFSDDAESPVAFSAMTDSDLPGLVSLAGAGTLEKYRGKGIYRSLVARRIADARAEGAKAAFIQADRSTSAPICARIGFTEVCSLELYGWTPD
jgi:predicted GNAT family acetyltransferase